MSKPVTGWVAAFAVIAAVCAAPALAQNSAPVDYGDPAAWLCLPDRDDACAVDQTTTFIAGDGSMAYEGWRRDPYAPIDCFYVYPTVSRDETANSDMTAGPGENGVAGAQFARFGSVCRTFAPLYRQATLTALRSRMSGGEMAFDVELGYNDVRAAWAHYLENENNGRGVVLIGHSQGASVLLRMIAEHIDGHPAQENVVSAILLGTNVQVPEGGGVGGSFRDLPLCRSDTQTGCIVTYSTYRSTIPPDPRALFGRGQGDYVAGCTNPAALAGGAAELSSYLGAGNVTPGGSWVDGGTDVETAYVSVPGLLTGECVSADGFSFLEVTVNGNPRDARADDIGGDIMTAGGPSATWGLHLIDVAVAMGDLVDLVQRQGEAFLEGSQR
ncbi:MAG: DUF3089 domain-containing protein [Gemmatimonadota bacterium]|nr:DUF3089 domain-containing protein [Gemmatimonadota bacterium]